MEAQANFSMDDVKELLFSKDMAYYQEKKGMLNYIKQLEEEITRLNEISEKVTKEQ